jgi:hypothetical protein
MEAVQELYKSESYIAQQGAAIDQALAQINMVPDVEAEPTIDMENILSNIKRNAMPIMVHKRVLFQWVFGKSKRKFLRMCQTIKINTKGSKIITI